MKRLVLLLVFAAIVSFALAQNSFAQASPTSNTTPYLLPRNGISAGLGFLGTTGDPGFTAVNVFGGLRHRAFEIAGEFNAGGTNIRVPDITIKLRQQDYLVGPRFYFSNAFRNPRAVPFVHLLFGVSHQSTDVTGGPSSSDNAYAWSVGGGVEYHISNKWGVRGRGDVYRTHFLDDTQTHARYGVGVLYIFGR